MNAITVRELNANISKAIARVEAGETLEIMKNGRIVAELRPRSLERSDAWRKAHKDSIAFMKDGLELGLGRVDPSDKYDDPSS